MQVVFFVGCQLDITVKTTEKKEENQISQSANDNANLAQNPQEVVTIPEQKIRSEEQKSKNNDASSKPLEEVARAQERIQKDLVPIILDKSEGANGSSLKLNGHHQGIKFFIIYFPSTFLIL